MSAHSPGYANHDYSKYILGKVVILKVPALGHFKDDNLTECTPCSVDGAGDKDLHQKKI